MQKLKVLSLFLSVLLSASVVFAQDDTADNDSIRLDLPSMDKGVYAISVVDHKTQKADTTGNDIYASLLLSSELRGRIEDVAYYFEETAKAEAAADLLMLTQGWRRYSMVEQSDTVVLKHSMETEQTITGSIDGIFHKVKTPKLRLLIPQTGYQAEFSLLQDTFCLSGLDFVDGTTIQIQALNKKSSDAFIELSIAEKEYPVLSNFHHKHVDSISVNNVANSEHREIRRLGDRSFELPNFNVTGRKIIPMNSRKIMPDRFLEKGNPYFERMPTMQLLLSRVGLQVGEALVEMDDGEETIIRCAGKWVMGKFIAAEVKLDNDRVTGYALEELLNMNPYEIQQIEYFLPSNYEMYGNLGGIKGLYGNAKRGGLLLIYTKSPTDLSRFKRERPLSLVTVRQLGYKPAVEFYQPQGTEFFDVPTLYWNPHLTSDGDKLKEILLPPIKKGSKYSVTVEGVSDDGEIVRHQDIISK